jgi:hypothetical protein
MLATRIKYGIVGGLMGGAVFGMMMLAMGTLPMIGKMVGQPNAAVGFLVHMVISACIGAGFGVALGGAVNSTARGLILGTVYGGAWWVLGPLTLMPLFMGMGLGVNWNGAAANAMLPSLMGHLVFGLVQGFAYSRGSHCFLAKVCGPSGKNEQGDETVPRAV